MTRKNSPVPHASPSRALVAGTILMGIGMGIGLSQPAAALSPATRDQVLQACHEKAMQVHRDAQEALMTYLRRLAAQPRNAAWQPETCEALRLSIAASQKRIDWQGGGNRICAERYKSSEMKAIRADLRDSNDKKRKLFRENCR
ncbi:hypothetical protein [Microvirga lenta]|uniref:hypothetical protein n=1 Tax=Microvirga lenta TaxID=2881337 RepID=UPI001CFCF80C|nr:hypothetical protein [Microvirga lenta]MCB5174717.1 hypothetical protein [Microvirga lenta]